ncbi:MAG: methyltransferase [Pseudomonadota bacterium]
MTAPPLNPGQLMEISGSYWKTCTLHAAVKLDLFTTIGDAAAGVVDIAESAGLNPDGVERLMNALTAMGLLEKAGGRFTNTETARRFLVRSSDAYLGYMIMHHHYLMPSWNRLTEAVRSGLPVRERAIDGDDDRREAFLMGMFNNASLIAPKVAEIIDLGGCRRLLDLGGGPGTFAIHFCKKHPELTAAIYDLGTTRPFAQKTVKKFGLEDRIRFIPGDYTSEELDGAFDAVWMSHILHGEDPATCQEMIRKAVGTLTGGGRIFIHEFILEDSGDGPLFPTLFSLNMLVGTDGGRSYTQAELVDMLTAAGVIDIQRLAFTGPTESGILAGRV